MVSTDKCLFSSLCLNALELPVKIGCAERERRSPQPVRFDLRLRFAVPPRGCQTDQIEDTPCYAQLSQIIRKISTQNEFQLIEKLGWDVHAALREALPSDCLLSLRVTKIHPPVPDLLGGASFAIGDWNENSWSF